MHDIFTLDEATGKLFWKQTSFNKHQLINTEAGSITKTGQQKKQYCKIGVNGKIYLRSRIVFYMVHGRWPELFVDHINGDTLDDRPCNLREVNRSQNAWNTSDRHRSYDLPLGVYKHRNKFKATIRCNNRAIYIGLFDTPEKAHEAYLTKRRELFGEYNRL